MGGKPSATPGGAHGGSSPGPQAPQERSGAERGPRNYEGSPSYHRFSHILTGISYSFIRISHSCIIDFLGFPRISIRIPIMDFDSILDLILIPRSS